MQELYSRFDVTTLTVADPSIPLQSATDHGNKTMEEIAEIFNCGPPKGKTRVTTNSMMKHGGFHRGLTLISDKMMTTPAFVMQRRESRHDQWTKDCDHQLHELVHIVACGMETGDYLSAPWWRLTEVVWAILFGNGCSYIDRDRFGLAKQLIPLPPDRTYLWYEEMQTPLRLENGRIKKVQKYYVTEVGGNLVKLRPENVFHLKNGVSICPDWSPSVRAYADDSFRTGLAATKFVGEQMDNGVNVSGVLMTPGHVKFKSDEEKREFQDKFNRAYSGLSNSGKILLLEEGFKFLQTSMENANAQLLESRKFSNAEASYFLRLHPATLGGDAPYGYNTPEMAMLSDRDSAFEFWWSQIESEYLLKIIPTDQRATHAVRFDRDHGISLPFRDKVEGYLRLWDGNIFPKSSIKDKFGEPICEQDDVYKDGQAVDCEDCDGVGVETDVDEPEVSEPQQINPEIVEGSKSLLIESIVRASSAFIHEFKQARTINGLGKFIDRRSDLENRFDSKIQKSLRMFELATGQQTGMTSGFIFKPVFGNIETILKTSASMIRLMGLEKTESYCNSEIEKVFNYWNCETLLNSKINEALNNET